MDPSEIQFVETPCSSFNLPAAGSLLSTSNSSTCNSCSYIRHHQRRRSRRAPATATNPITDGDSNCNANIIRDSTETMMIMRLKQDEAEVEEELPQQVIMSNSPPCDLMMLSGGATAQELQSEEEDEQDGDLMGNRRKRRVNTERSRCSVVSSSASSSSSSSSHIFPSSTTSTKFYHTSSSSSSRTALLFTFLSVALLMLSGTGFGVDGLRINQFGGYEDVVVSVGSDVPPITCQQLIQNLQMIFTSSSEYLNGATKGRAYFHRVQIVLPATWDSRACGKMLPASYTSTSSVGEAHFQIDGEHPVFGQRPWTQQSRGCGQQGEKIHVGYQYVMGYNDTDMAHAFPERAFVHEWAKYRYGVFEEIGFENDPIYPTSYYGEENYGSRGGSSSSSEKRPTSCTNKPLQGSWTGDCSGSSSSSSPSTVPSHQQQQHNHQSQYHYHHQQSQQNREQQQYASSSSSGESNDRSGANCVFVPFLTDNRNITSSLMSHPHLLNVRSFCDSTTHNKHAPTKHNFLCDQKSVSEVIYSHPDFHNSSGLSRNGRSVTPEFIIKQLTTPRFVLMVEETGNMNLRDVWKYLKLAIRKFIKYDLPAGTQIGLMTVGSDIRILANMTSLDENLRGILAEKLPNYPNIETGSLSLRKGISHAINMLKWNGQRVAGSVIMLISQGSISPLDLETSVHLLRQEEISIATIEYPSIGDGKISSLSQATRSPHYTIRETGVGTMSHMSTYIQLVNSMMEIQRFFTKRIAPKWPTLVHQEEFKGDAPSFVESSFSFDASQAPAEFYIYIPNPIDPKVNKVELTSPSGTRYTDQLSLLHDINVIKIDAIIDQPGIWRYRIERLGDSHQSHFVQVVTSTTASNAVDEFSVRLYSNVDETRAVNLSQMPLILYADVRRGMSPVLEADVEATVMAGTLKWKVKLFDSGNGDPDITGGDGIYSRYVIPPPSVQSTLLEISVKVRTSPLQSKFVGMDSMMMGGSGSSSSSLSSSSTYGRRRSSTNNRTPEPCCGSRMVPEWIPLKTMSYNERVVDSYTLKISNAKSSDFYRPSRIGDLRIINQYDKEVTLTFTAPGEDFDHKTVQSYQLFYRRSLEAKPQPKEPFFAGDYPAGSQVNLTINVPDHGLFYLNVVATDHYRNVGKPSNTVQLRAESPPPEPNSGSTQKQTDTVSSRGNGEDSKLSSTDIVLIVVGVVGFLVLVALIIIICIYCRRRGTKGMGSTETKISTISDNKAPIHWSASQLLNEHEKRQSIYAQSSNSASQQGSFGPGSQTGGGGGGGGQPGQQLQQQHANHNHNHHHFNGSPGSSTRSFRSISENARKTSVDYESCSSDPTMRSMKGVPTDYETPIESDQENYRTIDSYSGVPYRINGVNGVGPPPSYVPRMNGTLPHNTQQQHHFHQNIPVNSTNSSSHMQYNPNIQGSLTSVNSKRRNITMV